MTKILIVSLPDVAEDLSLNKEKKKHVLIMHHTNMQDWQAADQSLSPESPWLVSGSGKKITLVRIKERS